MVDRRPIYLDASAIVKLIVREPETDALREFIVGDAVVLTSRLSTIEVRRAIARLGQPGDDEHAQKLLGALQLIELDAAIADSAGSIAPSTLRSVDAIHLAAALSIRDELDSVVTYDLRLADAARAAGLQVAAPE